MLIGLPPNVLKYTRFLQRRRDVAAGRHRGDRRAVAQALGHRDDVGRHAPVLVRPVVIARAAEAALHFVGNAQPAVLADDVVHDLEVLRLRRRMHDAADALDRLGDEARDLAGRLVLDDLLHLLRTLAGRTRETPARTGSGSSSTPARGECCSSGCVANRQLPWAVSLIGVDVPPW